jgi:outer membrane protein TolC
MTLRSRSCVFAIWVLPWLAGAVQAQSTPAGDPDHPAGPPSVVPDYSQGARAFPDILNPYRPTPVQALHLENSPRLHDLIHDERLRLSLSDALALTIENNLDIAVQRYVHPIGEVDVLRASSGQAARGVPGARLPSGLSAGALGVGVNQAGGTGGVGSAGGISGGGGAVSVPQVGTFDPAISLNASYDRTVAPLNSVVVAGVPRVTTNSSAGSVSYTQLFPLGSSVTWAVAGIEQNSTQQALLFNPAAVSRLAMGFNQPLLNGFGLMPNKRFVMVAANNLKTSDELFRQQVATTVVQVEDAYWDLTASRQIIVAAQRALDAARQLVDGTKIRAKLGAVAGIDVVSAESAAAAAERDLIVARTNFQLQQAQLKNLLSKMSDAELDRAEIETTDALPDPDGRPLPDVQAAQTAALANRPELQASMQDLQNQDISVRFTRNGLLPNVSTFGLYAGAGLTGDTVQLSNGLGASLGQILGATYPEYAGGVSATIPIRNRSAQADHLRARLEEDQLKVQVQQTRQRIRLEVQQAVINLMQGQAQVGAAHEAVRLAQLTADAEQKKLQLGVSDAYNVVLRERDLFATRQADVAATAAYAKALVDFDRATGTTLESNGIALTDALTGQMLTPPSPAIVGTGVERPHDVTVTP